ERNDLAVVAAGDDARAVRRRAEDAAKMHLDRRNFAGRIGDEDFLLGADEAGIVAEEIRRRDGRAQRQRAHLVGHRSDGGGLAWIELFHHVTMQLAKPSRIICSGSSRPMKTT